MWNSTPLIQAESKRNRLTTHSKVNFAWFSRFTQWCVIFAKIPTLFPDVIMVLSNYQNEYQNSTSWKIILNVLWFILIVDHAFIKHIRTHVIWSISCHLLCSLYQGHVVYWIRVPNWGTASKGFVMLISSINFTKACHRKIVSVPFNTINDSAYIWIERTIRATFELLVGYINLAHEYILYIFLSITTQVPVSHSTVQWKTASVLQEVPLTNME